MAWKRRLFFIFEALKITPSERKSVGVLLLLIAVLATASQYVESKVITSDEQYAALEAEFERRSEALKQEEAELMKRYNPAPLALTVNEAISSDTTDSSSAAMETGEVTEKININTADSETLQKLTGIGPTYAQRIIDYRNEAGPFKTVDELLKIKGIGKKRLEKIKPFIKLKE